MKKKVSEIFNNPPAPEDLIIKECQSVLEEISNRYLIECNTTVTKGQVNKINTILSQIYNLNQ